MSFPAFAHELAAAPAETDAGLTSLGDWLNRFKALTGHSFDPMAALSVLTPALIQAVLTRNPAVLFAAIMANLAVIFPKADPVTVKAQLVAFNEATPLQLAA